MLLYLAAYKRGDNRQSRESCHGATLTEHSLTAQYLHVLSKLSNSEIALDLTVVETLHETSVYLLKVLTQKGTNSYAVSLAERRTSSANDPLHYTARRN